MSYQAIGWVLRDAPGVPPQCVSVLIGLAEHADKLGRGAYPSAATLAEYARKSERQVRYDLSVLLEAKLIRPGDQSEVMQKFPPNRRPVAYDLAMERIRSKLSDCAYCGAKADTTDHIIPTSRGGTDLPANRVPACGKCNSSKRDLTLEEWIATGRAPAGAFGVQSASPQLAVQSTSPLGRRGMQSTAPQVARQPTAPLGAGDQQERLGVQSTAPLDGMVLGCNGAQPGVQPTADKPSIKPPKTKNAAKHEVADALAAAFWDRHRDKTAQSFIAIRGIVRTAIANGLPRNDVAHALDKLARECIAVSGGAITNALREIYPDRYGKSDSGSGRAPGPERARGWMEAARVHSEATKQAGRELPHG